MEKLNKDIIAFNRRKVLVNNADIISLTEEKNSERNLLLFTLLDELKEYGYYLSVDVMNKISKDEIENLHKTIIPYLFDKYNFGGRKYKPLYPGFPKQVISKSRYELKVDQLKVYSGNLDEFIDNNPWIENIPTGKKVVKDPTKELKLMTDKEFMEIPKQIMLSNNSLSEGSNEELIWFLENYPNLDIPDKIPFKETLCIVVKHRPSYELNEINDILRYGMYLMGANPSLPNVPKYEKPIYNYRIPSKNINKDWRNLSTLSRKYRKDICNRIERVIELKGVESCIIDAKRFYGHWILLSERVHPMEFTLRYPECSSFFSKLKSKSERKLYKTFNSKIQKMYDDKADIVDIAKEISKRPGELVRRFDSLIRKAINVEKESEIMDLFLDTEGMKNKTLLELNNYYNNRENPDIPRLVTIEGKSVTLDKLSPLPDGLIDTVQEFIFRKILLNIKERITEKDLDGKFIVLDPEIKKLAIPKGMRDSVISIPAGTRIPIKEGKNIIRFFVHWYQDPQGPDEDLDLHAFLYKNDNCVENIGWNSSYYTEGYCAIHSGDVLNRPGNCAEYVDIDLEKSVLNGYKYVVMDVYNYKNRDMDTLPCFIGYCSVDKMESSTNWEPGDVELSVPVKVKSSKVATLLVDLVNREVIVLNCNLSGIPVNTNGNVSTQVGIVKFFTAPVSKYNSYEIMKQYYIFRGATVIDKLPEDLETQNLVAEDISLSDISHDYVKLLDIIGE